MGCLDLHPVTVVRLTLTIVFLLSFPIPYLTAKNFQDTTRCAEVVPAVDEYWLMVRHFCALILAGDMLG